jgi:TPP-dependent pyruvate/acetoin dehydrogenase alpha subunit
MSYVPKELYEEWERRDPIDRYGERLVADFRFSKDEVDGMRDDVRAYVDECSKKALESPMPDRELATDGVYAEGEEFQPLGDGNAPWSRWSHNLTGNGAAPVERRAA